MFLNMFFTKFRPYARIMLHLGCVLMVQSVCTSGNWRCSSQCKRSNFPTTLLGGECCQEECNLGILEPCNPGTLEPWNLGTLRPWNLAFLEPWNPASLESWNPATWALATVESCNLETLPDDVATWNPTTLDLSKSWALQPWNPAPWHIATLEPWTPVILEL